MPVLCFPKRKLITRLSLSFFLGFSFRLTYCCDSDAFQHFACTVATYILYFGSSIGLLYITSSPQGKQYGNEPALIGVSKSSSTRPATLAHHSAPLSPSFTLELTGEKLLRLPWCNAFFDSR